MASEPQLTVQDVAERMHAHPETVRRWLRAGRLRGYRPGGDKLGWRTSQSDLDAFIVASRAESADDEEG